MFNHKSEYALNKTNKSSIDYIDANDNITMLTAREFSSKSEFRKWKIWTDMKFHAEGKMFAANILELFSMFQLITLKRR